MTREDGARAEPLDVEGGEAEGSQPDGSRADANQSDTDPHLGNQPTERMLAAALEHVANAVVITDVDGTILWVNDGFTRMSGYRREEAVGENPRLLRSGLQDDAVYAELWQTVLAGETWRGELVERHRDGHHYTVTQTITPITTDDGRVTHFLSVHQDVTAERRADAALRFQAHLLATIGEAVIASDLDGTVTYANPAAIELFGWHDRDVTGRSLTEIDFPAAWLEHADEVLETVGQGATWSGQVHLERSGRHELDLLLTNAGYYDERGELAGVIGVATDISDLTDTRRLLAQRSREIGHLATHDPVTGLPNRTLLLDRLEQARGVARRGNSSLALMVLDLDDFKAINDGLGHEQGDLLLRGIGERLSEQVGAESTVARLSGDEFVVLCPQTDAATAVDHAKALQAALGRGFTTTRGVLTITASIGIVAGDDTTSAPLLLRFADTAMHQAKIKGRNRTEVFTDDMQSAARSRFTVSTLLRRALDEGGPTVRYQPVIEVATGRIVGAEALARLRHEDGSFVPADTFIAVAEETGLIVLLGEQVLRRACTDAAGWISGQPDFRLSVNVSPYQLTHEGVRDEILGVLDDTGTDPASLWLEVTESALVYGPSADATVRELEAMGLGFAIDDFGTGYSSLAHLRRMPVGMLKIDREFVSGLHTDIQDHALVTATIDIARTFGLAVTAEGVETAEQLAELRELGCDLAQGYLWSPPVTADEITAMLDDQGERERRRVAGR